MRVYADSVHVIKATLRSWLWVCLAILFSTLLVVQPTYALSSEQLNIYRNGVNYFDAEQTTDCIIGSSGGTGSTPLSGSDNAEKAFNYFVSKGLTPVQVAGIIGNMMIESTMDPAAQQDGSNSPVPKNGVGFGIVQWTYTDRQQPLVALAQRQNVPVNTLPPQLDFVWVEFQGGFKSMYTKLKGATTVENATSIVLNEYEMPAERILNLKLRTEKAKEVLTRYGSTNAVVSAGNYTTQMCGVGGPGAVAGNIVQTALNYAWDTKGHGYLESDAKPSYRADMPKHNGATDTFPYSDCGVFVATVMVASGADKDFVKRGTTMQMNYMASHPDKYREIPDTTSTAPLQPGDILVNTEHIYIYVGKQANGFNSVAASLHTDRNVGHVPQPDNWYAGFRAFRLISNSPEGGA